MKPVTVRLIAVGLAALPAAPLAAQDMWLEVSIGCQMWTEARGEDSAAPYEAYLVGMLDGMTVASRLDFWGDGDGRVQLTRDAAFGFVDGFCQEHPDQDILIAAQAMFAARTGVRSEEL